MKLTVVIPTFRRTADLGRCLEALTRQTRRPDQVIVVARIDDGETRRMLADYPPERLPLQLADTGDGGQVAALNAGLRAALGDIVAIVDDDTAPWVDWLARIERHFLEQPRLGGLGGRDIIQIESAQLIEETSLVCRVLWYGRWIGQAHRGFGPVRPVDLLKGCNMSYRREALDGICFDRRLRGGGAQWFNDAALSLAVRKAGWEVLYDPAVLVDHFMTTRPDGVERLATAPTEVYDIVYNETLILLGYLPPLRRLCFLAFGFGVGHQRAPGLLQWIRAGVRGDGHTLAFQLAAWKGRRDAWRDYRAQRHAPTDHLAPAADERRGLLPS